MASAKDFCQQPQTKATDTSLIEVATSRVINAILLALLEAYQDALHDSAEARAF